MQSTEGSNGWVKIELPKNELIGEALLDLESESPKIEENEQQSVTTEFTGNEGNAEADKTSCLETKEVAVGETPQKEVNKGEALEVKGMAVTEKPEQEVALKEAQSEGGDIAAEQGINADADNTEALAEQKGEQSLTSPLMKKLPILEHGENDGDKNLIEENKNLRKMMQKLLEAGNEQLAVISNLTGRVKDLEKKLAKKRRVKTKQCRPTTSKPSSKKSSNNPLQGRAIGIAM